MVSLGNHDAGIGIVQRTGRGALEGDADAQLQWGKIGVNGAIVVGIANHENLTRENACLSNGASVGKIGFGLENREDDGVAFDEDFFGAEAIEEFLDRLVQIQAEMKRGA